MSRLLSGIVLALGVTAAGLLLPGCSTGRQIRTQNDGPAVFGGMRMMVALLGSDQPHVKGDGIMAVVDSPFSLVADILILPFSIINEIAAGGITVEVPPPVKKPPRKY